jgi:hypothetical protein
MSTNPQSMKTSYKGNSPAGRVMNEAIELDIEGCSPYPQKATFIDADTPYVSSEIRRAVANGNAIVLVEADGSTLTLRAEPNGAVSADEPAPTAKA